MDNKTLTSVFTKNRFTDTHALTAIAASFALRAISTLKKQSHRKLSMVRIIGSLNLFSLSSVAP